MQLGRMSYFLDFLLAPAILFAMHFSGASSSCAQGAIYAPAALGLGFLTWTMLEYAIHRWLFHRSALFRPSHHYHHRNPEALFGAPPIVGPLLIVLVFFAPARFLGIGYAEFGTAGVLLGYLAYVLIHYDAHARLDSLAPFLGPSRRRHMLHHFAASNANFGITTALWDHVFGTMFAIPSPAESRSP
jgi:sterol desaturase/sphingolipid hydroxylase (fatty acid hydroxylase superfamily)